ncbi:MAG: hypothetical protein ACK4UQ_08280 [Brevundimonas sp.]
MTKPKIPWSRWSMWFVIFNRQNVTTMKSPGRPRNPSAHVIASPLAAFIDAKWDKTGLTNEQGAAYFGFTAPNMISHWRTGRSAVSLSHIPKLASLLGADEAALFVMWLKQQRLRDKTIPAHLVELLEQRLVTANEAVLVNAVRSTTKNGDPAFNAKTIAAMAAVVAP